MLSEILLVQLLLAAVAVIPKSADGVPLPTPKQNLPQGAGFIPVFVRVGDTPLEDINPLLAEAFEVYAIKNGSDVAKEQIRTPISVKELEIPIEKKLPQHVQKIPKNN
nr:unnamed protein product [Callosobruchus analis]